MNAADYIKALQAGVNAFVAATDTPAQTANNPTPPATNLTQQVATGAVMPNSGFTASTSPAAAPKASATPASPSWFDSLLDLFRGSNWAPAKIS
ncbi:MAG: hypothetical protein KGJ60_09570 [Verrucomicrobiota bacterium]|nr:hypothetical protein [Verrucomicrobiota bacterium]